MRHFIDLIQGFNDHDLAVVETDPRFKDVVRDMKFLRGAREAMGTSMQQSAKDIRAAMERLGETLWELERDYDVPSDAIRLLSIEAIKGRDH